MNCFRSLELESMSNNITTQLSIQVPPFQSHEQTGTRRNQKPISIALRPKHLHFPTRSSLCGQLPQKAIHHRDKSCKTRVQHLSVPLRSQRPSSSFETSQYLHHTSLCILSKREKTWYPSTRAINSREDVC